MDLNLLSATSSIDKVKDGTGIIAERTVKIGNTVLSVENIGTLSVLEGQKSSGLLVLGALVCLIGLFIATNMGPIGLIVLLIGAAIGAWWLAITPDSFLLIGTSDGRQTQIISKNKSFLEDMQFALKKKIDSKTTDGAIINITAGNISGALVVGDNNLTNNEKL